MTDDNRRTIRAYHTMNACDILAEQCEHVLMNGSKNVAIAKLIEQARDCLAEARTEAFHELQKVSPK